MGLPTKNYKPLGLHDFTAYEPPTQNAPGEHRSGRGSVSGSRVRRSNRVWLPRDLASENPRLPTSAYRWLRVAALRLNCKANE
jgi:hypothetical protein